MNHERPAVRVSKPRQSEVNLNPGVEIEARGQFGETVRIELRNTDSGFRVSLQCENGHGSAIIVSAHGTADLDNYLVPV